MGIIPVMLARLFFVLNLFLLCCLMMLLLTGSTLLITDPKDHVHAITRPVEFDYFSWTMEALGVKLTQAALDTPFYFPKGIRQQIVADYMQTIEQILVAEHQLNIVYTDPTISNPEATSVELRAGLESLYSQQKSLAPVAEAVLQEQISIILVELGLTVGGQPIPPVLFHISPLPYHLVVSPRERIQQDAAISIHPDIHLDAQVALEAEVDSRLNVSSLVVPIGGIGSYPTMVMRTTSLDWLADTIAHEWIHNWLNLRPLGMNYSSSPELRTMNETTASIAGHEIARMVLLEYYPELVAQAEIIPISWMPEVYDPGDVPFDFRAAMHLTRIRVDELLAQGMIEEAEAYMEERRQYLWERGYTIRKLNQAYFAFYGAYADVPGGAAGEDPVGPAVRQLRVQSNSLHEFLDRIAQMTTYHELQAMIIP